ncbi:hypothetical protein H2201_004451 [Coniosporium apollinis]|uniref:Tail specific protease domain-containing protein n=1 Tax=Coniosporium apollinis TaxID=61459 RepID=A0ABQ9NVS8_9PEZI|nr:hypothetical protein H2201_004451 [Coniosporium apollinis]
MRSPSVWLAACIGLAAASPLRPHDVHTLYPRQNASTPCALASAAVAAAPRAAVPTIPAELAYNCLTSVPLNATAGLRLLESIRPYIQWQSTLTWLKNPPAEYVEKVQGPVDVIGNLDKIEGKLQSKEYLNEYEFLWELYTSFAVAHDGHLNFIPDLVGGIFNFGRTVPLVSVSEDGKKLPAVFAYADVLQASFPNKTYEPSAVVSIDGQGVNAFLQNWSQWGSLQDRDALYNNVFFNLPSISLGPSGSGQGMFVGGGRARWVYPGPTTEITFANGTTSTYQNIARVLVSLRQVQDARTLVEQYITYSETGSDFVRPDPQSPHGSGDEVITETVTATPIPDPTVSVPGVTSTVAVGPTSTVTPPPGYPAPVITQTLNYIGGYYIDDAGYEDVAVLTIPSFVGVSGVQEDFQRIVTEFLALAKAAGKTKLIIDLQANGGGTILLGHDLFKQLFPSIEPFSASRFRAHDAPNFIGQQYSELAGQYPRDLDVANRSALEYVSSVFNYRSDVDLNRENFESWSDKYDQHKDASGDTFSSLIRWNLSDVLTPLNSGGINVTGYNNRANVTEQPFAASDIVILTDGYCASTCTLFTEMMRQQAGVKTIAMGGRSQPGPIQAIGGVKGANVFPWSYVQYLVEATYAESTEEEKAAYNATEMGLYKNYIPFERAAIGPNVNFRDAIREGDEGEREVPQQFVWEAADCRIFYTAEMTLAVEATWRAAADSAFGTGESKCVAGGIGGGAPVPPVPKPYGGRSRRGVEVSRRAAVPVLGRREEGLWERLDVWTNIAEANLDGDGIMLP